MCKGAYACMDLALACIKRGALLISRLRFDAQIFEFPVAEKNNWTASLLKASAYTLRTDSGIQPKYGVNKPCSGMAKKLVM